MGLFSTDKSALQGERASISLFNGECQTRELLGTVFYNVYGMTRSLTGCNCCLFVIVGKGRQCPFLPYVEREWTRMADDSVWMYWSCYTRLYNASFCYLLLSDDHGNFICLGRNNKNLTTIKLFFK